MSQSAQSVQPPPPDWSALATALLERELAGAHGDAVALAAADDAVRAGEEEFGRALHSDTALPAIAAAAELDDVAIRVLAVCGAVDLDRRLQLVISSLRNNAAVVRPDLDLLARMLGPDAVGAVAPDGPLACAELIELQPGVPLASAQIGVPRPVAFALLGDLSLDPDLPVGADVLIGPPDAIGTSDFVLVRGADRTRRLQAAMRTTTGISFLVSPLPQDESEWRAVVRQATLGGLGVVLELTGELTPLARHFIERAAHLGWALCSAAALPIDRLPQLPFVELDALPATVAEAEWEAVFPGTRAPARRPTADQLRLAGLVAAAGSAPDDAVRRVASGSLLKHATRITPQVGWDELILPGPQLQRLHDLVDRYRYRGVVHDEWGLPLYPSPGVVALFSGPSGTGKTTTAEVIAHELGVDMFRVDLSALVSKYIGETEKNLEEIFSAAHAGDYLLLFDEADSLFGTRSKVSDARDRYANMEVSYLLQRLETYDGFVVLTSNFQGNIDQAFLRRIHVTVHFAVPSVEDRVRIWERSLGNAPRDELDLGFVADKFDLTGGSIRNAALTAAFYAAGGERAVRMADVLLAVTQEMIKLGRRTTDEQYGRWRSELKD